MGKAQVFSMGTKQFLPWEDGGVKNILSHFSHPNLKFWLWYNCEPFKIIMMEGQFKVHDGGILLHPPVAISGGGQIHYMFFIPFYDIWHNFCNLYNFVTPFLNFHKTIKNFMTEG